jgi:hypothetical protein
MTPKGVSVPKIITINKCSPEECWHCYDNGQDIYCSKPDRLGLMNVFPEDSFKDFPKDCPLDNAVKKERD